MAIPRVFISSTCYDLKYIRENIKFFVKTLGYEPILSEDGAVFFDPKSHTHDACLAEVPNCQLFVLVIGGRFGAQFKGGEHSVTNAEYREAIRLKIPVFALVESSVYGDFYLYIRNKTNTGLDPQKIIFPSVDSAGIFDFIEEVRSNITNNALVPFRDFSDMETYLRQQWAGMMFSFLTSANEQARVSDMFAALTGMSEKIEMLSKQILTSVGTDSAKLDAALYEEMIASSAIRDMALWKLRPTPISVLLYSSFRSCAKALGVDPKVDEATDMESVGYDGTISRPAFVAASRSYQQLHIKLIEIIRKHNKTPEEYVTESGIRTNKPLALPKDIEDHVGIELDSAGKQSEIEPDIKAEPNETGV